MPASVEAPTLPSQPAASQRVKRTAAVRRTAKSIAKRRAEQAFGTRADLGPVVARRTSVPIMSTRKWSLNLDKGEDVYGEDRPARLVDLQTQRPPEEAFISHGITWLGIGVTALFAGSVNYLMTITDALLLGSKQGWFLKVSGDPATSTLALLGHNVLLGMFGSFLVALLGTQASGSGVPEIKGYLNGQNLTGVLEGCLNVRTTVARVFGVILIIVSGLPAGREGPMVCIGGACGVVGFWLAGLIAQKYGIDMDMLCGFMQRDGGSLRMGCIIGGTAGLSAAFNAPVGAVLFMFEEIASAWPSSMTFHAFFAALIAQVTSQLLLKATGIDVEQLIIFDSKSGGLDSSQDVEAAAHRLLAAVAQANGTHVAGLSGSSAAAAVVDAAVAASGGHGAGAAEVWTWNDVPFFILLGLLTGIIAGLETLACLCTYMGRRRSTWRRNAIKSILEVGGMIAVMTLCTSLIPWAVGCAPEPPEPAVKSGHGVWGFPLISTGCPDGEFNGLATMFQIGAEGVAKGVFNRSEHIPFTVDVMLVFLFIYFSFYVLIRGLMVPMGSFVPNLVFGGIIGRVYGLALQDVGGVAVPGVYAFVGSCGMLAGWTHMTLAVMVLMLEAGGDLSMIIPVMLCVSVSRAVAKYLSRGESMDEHMIQIKGVPYLHDHLPYVHNVTAHDIADRTQASACLVMMTRAELKLKLQVRPTQLIWPLLRDKNVIGQITRDEVEDLAGVDADNEEELDQTEVIDIELADEAVIKAPPCVLMEASFASVYEYFGQMGVHLVCVLNNQGAYLGCITRTQVISLIEDYDHDKNKKKHVFPSAAPPEDRRDSTDSDWPRPSQWNPARSSGGDTADGRPSKEAPTHRRGLYAWLALAARYTE